MQLMKNSVLLALATVSDDGVFCLWSLSNLLEPLVSMQLNTLVGAGRARDA